MERFLLLGAVASVLVGCVPLPAEDAGNSPPPPRSSMREFEDLDPGAKELVSLHFSVRAYGSGNADAVSALCENLYSRLMNDTGLYSFLPREPYRVIVYGDREEYLRKTGMPQWSGGLSAGNAIYAYESRNLPGVLAHEMTHLIFREYLDRDDLSLRWVNEGLAVYEEREALAAQGYAADLSRDPVLSFQEMLLLAPMDERERNVSAWYRQVGSVVRFLIERGGRVGFGQFMRALKDGQRAGDALRTGFPAQWRDLDALETSWRDGR
ncbi:MAG: hypothetical protein AUJ52_08775 [Elusimicrobia bacterium CG1_02_63_36]|nr:MAG: hypothetical protein AUJ52_08775 [Elusimicrobia bacterium CG1_02_63_36]PIP84615.1 MAG: hypothetical protein COR54_03180 [Elusimicrobia bacterium CG22_combo_CG10-13_8_21_14_all_63_91]PJA16036.1 MAG: hypothetical protein COX66_08575 [Elusimicrobia bacterium CG_4_10_14_0_2_um_filter_63_34]PJB22923.1 MAG: hypothetical protein CO113_19915 [Elusimicrobia bacterium CG_4_9_14_3_um_filter_62_55]